MIEIKDNPKREVTEMDKLIDEMMNYICDELCRYPRYAESQEELDQACAGCRLCEFRQRIMDTYDRMVEKQRWIPVTERLPETEGFVLVIVNGHPRKNIELDNALQLAEYNPEDGWILEMYPEWEDADVVAWILLPEPYRSGLLQEA